VKKVKIKQIYIDIVFGLCFYWEMGTVDVKLPVAGLLNKMLMPSSSFRCYQNFKYEIYDFGHTLLCYLSQT